MTLSLELLKKLPKVELHCHLDGSLRVKSILDLAQKQKVDLPSTHLDELTKILTIGKNRGTLEEYLARFEITLSVMQTPEGLERAAFELVEDAARENVRYIEIRYSPILHTEMGMTPDETVDAVKKGLKSADRKSVV